MAIKLFGIRKKIEEDQPSRVHESGRHHIALHRNIIICTVYIETSKKQEPLNCTYRIK